MGFSLRSLRKKSAAKPDTSSSKSARGAPRDTIPADEHRSDTSLGSPAPTDTSVAADTGVARDTGSAAAKIQAGWRGRAARAPLEPSPPAVPDEQAPAPAATYEFVTKLENCFMSLSRCGRPRDVEGGAREGPSKDPDAADVGIGLVMGGGVLGMAAVVAAL